MRLISHRGNLNGPSAEENSPASIQNALDSNFEVEVDVWNIQNNLWLGHDKPQYTTSVGFLKNPRIWCHAKNLQALELLQEHDIHYFWHQKDDVTLTSQNYVWTYPGKELIYNSIAVMPELAPNFWLKSNRFAGVCSDYIVKIARLFK